MDSDVLEKADVIIAVDNTSYRETIFYGKSLLRLAAYGYEMSMGSGFCRYHVLKIPLDWDSDEPEILADLCVTIKGSCDVVSINQDDGDRYVE